MRTPARLAAAALLGAIAGCNQTSPSPGEQALPAVNFDSVFTVSPMDLAQARTLTPLGHIQPVGHVLPTDHVYFYQVDLDAPYAPSSAVLPVVAPAPGVVKFMITIPPINDVKIDVTVNSHFSYYLDHVFPNPEIKVGTILTAGQVIGRTGPGASLDLGAYDTLVTLPGLLSPERYPAQTLHCVSPWKYFAEPLKSEIYSRIRRMPSPDRDGRIDYDVAGRLVGSWFDSSVSGLDTSGPLGWPKSLAFAYDYNDPSAVRISIGGTIAAAGLWTIEPSAPRPEDVSVASGALAYRLLSIESLTQGGLMLVQLLDDRHLRVEVWEGSQAATAVFDGRAVVYRR